VRDEYESSMKLCAGRIYIWTIEVSVFMSFEVDIVKN